MVLPHVSMSSVFPSCCRSPLAKSQPPKRLSQAANRDVEELDAEIDARHLRSSFYSAASAEQLLAIPVTTSLTVPRLLVSSRLTDFSVSAMFLVV